MTMTLCQCLTQQHISTQMLNKSKQGDAPTLDLLPQDTGNTAPNNVTTICGHNNTDHELMTMNWPSISHHPKPTTNATPPILHPSTTTHWHWCTLGQHMHNQYWCNHGQNTSHDGSNSQLSLPHSFDDTTTMTTITKVEHATSHTPLETTEHMAHDSLTQPPMPTNNATPGLSPSTEEREINGLHFLSKRLPETHFLLSFYCLSGLE